MAEPILTGSLASVAIAKGAAAASEGVALVTKASGEMYRHYIEARALAQSAEKGEVEDLFAVSAFSGLSELQAQVIPALASLGLVKTETSYAGIGDAVTRVKQDVSEGMDRLRSSLEEQGLKATIVNAAEDVTKALEDSWVGMQEGLEGIKSSPEFQSAMQWAGKWGDRWSEGGAGAVIREAGGDLNEARHHLARIDLPGESIRFIVGSMEKASELVRGLRDFAEKAAEEAGSLPEYVSKGWTEQSDLAGKLGGVEEGFLRWVDEATGVNLTAKRVDRVLSVGGVEIQLSSSFEDGGLTRVPFVGEISKVLSKYGLEEEITVQDMAGAGLQCIEVVTLAWSFRGVALAGKMTAEVVEEGGTRVIKEALEDIPLKAGGSMGAGRLAGLRVGETIQRDLHAWRNVTVAETNENLFPSLVERFRHPLLRENPEVYARDLLQRDAKFQDSVAKWAERLKGAQSQGPLAVDEVHTKLKRDLSAQLGSRMTEDAVRPFFNGVTREVKAGLEDSVTGIRSTRVDLVFEEAKGPLRWSGGYCVEKGGILPVEVKTGQIPYLRQQGAHLVDQTAGHAKIGGNGLVVVSRNFPSDAHASTMREMMRHSSIHRFLPEKDLLDKAVSSLVRDEAGRIPV